jgi:hypothetical protein
VGEAKAFLGQKLSQLKAEAAQKLQQIEQVLQEEAATKDQQVRRKPRHYGHPFALSKTILSLNPISFYFIFIGAVIKDPTSLS